MAKWITSPEQPLTARVIANRIWQWHFGRGIVATPNDFGTQGAAPSHRELLDWLAADLREDGWRLKNLHRAIMLSRTYRQGSRREPAALAADPENILLAGFPRRRMEAEAVWDRLLEASGRLDRRPVDEPFVSCPVRQTTIVPGQALALLNGDIPLEQATALRERLFREEPASIENRLNRAWMLVFARPIQAAELAQAREFLGQRPEKPPADVWMEFCLALLNASEFVYVD